MRHEHHVCLAVEFVGRKATISNAFATDDLLEITRGMNLADSICLAFTSNVPRM